MSGGDLSAPGSNPISFVLHVVLRDGCVTLGSSPAHPQCWSLLSNYLGQSHASHLGRDLQSR